MERVARLPDLIPALTTAMYNAGEGRAQVLPMFALLLQLLPTDVREVPGLLQRAQDEEWWGVGEANIFAQTVLAMVVTTGHSDDVLFSELVGKRLGVLFKCVELMIGAEGTMAHHREEMLSRAIITASSTPSLLAGLCASLRVVMTVLVQCATPSCCARTLAVFLENCAANRTIEENSRLATYFGFLFAKRTKSETSLGPAAWQSCARPVLHWATVNLLSCEEGSGADLSLFRHCVVCVLNAVDSQSSDFSGPALPVLMIRSAALCLNEAIAPLEAEEGQLVRLLVDAFLANGSVLDVSLVIPAQHARAVGAVFALLRWSTEHADDDALVERCFQGVVQCCQEHSVFESSLLVGYDTIAFESFCALFFALVSRSDEEELCDWFLGLEGIIVALFSTKLHVLQECSGGSVADTSVTESMAQQLLLLGASVAWIGNRAEDETLKRLANIGVHAFVEVLRICSDGSLHLSPLFTALDNAERRLITWVADVVASTGCGGLSLSLVARWWVQTASLGNQPGHVEALVQLARLLFTFGEGTLAIKYLRKACAKHVENLTWIEAGMTLRELCGWFRRSRKPKSGSGLARALELKLAEWRLEAAYHFLSGRAIENASEEYSAARELLMKDGDVCDLVAFQRELSRAYAAETLLASPPLSQCTYRSISVA